MRQVWNNNNISDTHVTSKGRLSVKKTGAKKIIGESFEMLGCQCCSNCAQCERTNKLNTNDNPVVLMAFFSLHYSLYKSQNHSTKKPLVKLLLQSNLRLRPPLVSHHLSSATSFPKYHNFLTVKSLYLEPLVS